MDLHEKIRNLPARPGVYLYKNADGEVIYVGKAKNLRSRVRSYILDGAQANAKTGSLMREAVDVDSIQNVRAYPGAQIVCFADVDHLPVGILVQIHPGPGRQVAYLFVQIHEEVPD